MRATGPSVVIIGAGIIGASAAYALQKAGARVTIVDAGGETATASSFGWINASFHHDAAHFRLREEGLAAWKRLGSKLDLPVSWRGTLCWEETGEALTAQHDQLCALGYAVREIDQAEFTSLEPHIAEPPVRALHFAAEASVDSIVATNALLDAAASLGAQRLRGLKVEEIMETKGRFAGIRTQAGITLADHVLIAAGTGTAALMTQAGVPMSMLRRPALVLRTRPVPPVLRHVLVSQFGELRQLGDGTLLMPAAVDHQGDSSETVTDSLEDTADQVLIRLRSLLPHLTLDWQELTLAFRPVPQDELPVIGAVAKGLHVACMHSGITLGALAGELVAQEMLEGVTNQSGALLAAYRPSRFAK
ncbi:FAD-dependent oxidoreductase [uncultured Sulfitobacter sp.]|uniref:NAD(P)/FAD-dependent oxidoreductase n=1 Tax=uncultured Sulfitobacter sp. TaxID=191468 RepID=UPI00263018A5|nr:FAD-dependent oxidoreductase [uncultured Sulfitobacter sp.]